MEIETQNKFWSNVKKTNNCWLYLKAKDKDGYGVFHTNGKNYRAHRISFMLCKGEITEGMLICHTCDNPSCVNPKHLFMGTSKENVLDMIKKGRTNYVGTPKLSKAQVLEIRKLHSSRKILHKDLGKMFGVHRKTVGDILNRVTWASI